MTPRSIETGRALATTTVAVVVAGATAVQLVPSRGDRVALSVAVAGNAFGDPLLGITIGINIGGALVPLTTLTLGHPACYLSVDKIGTSIMPAISASNLTGGSVTLGVTEVRQIQPLGAE